MPKMTPKAVYQIKITLRGSKPPVWRRFQVGGDITLGKLHRITQAVMGWCDGHLHQFRDGRNRQTEQIIRKDFNILGCFTSCSV